jgi:hypothetical protein
MHGNEIEKVSFSAACGWFTIYGTGGRRIRISFLIPGLPAFLVACEKHLPPQAMAPAAVGYAVLGRKLPEADATPA